MSEQNLVIVAIGFLVCALCQWVAWRVKMPAIIFLLLTGILAGPVFGIVSPEELLGHTFYPFISLSVAIILFEGSLTLRFREILGLEAVVRNMLSFGLLITWGITTLTARYAVGISWEIATLFGAITVVTGPTVIAPLLRTVRPTPAVANILRWEGIVIDPLGAALAVLVYEFIISGGGSQAIGHTMQTFGKILLTGGTVGVATGFLFGHVLRRHLMPEFLHNISILGLVFSSFVLSNVVQPDSGLITVTVMGILLANMKGVDLDGILEFKEQLSILLVSLLFVLLSASLDVEAIQQLGWSVLLIFVAIQFIARPLNVMFSAIGSKLSFPERHLLAWIAPRGIVAAAISSLFAIQLSQAGYQDADLLVPLTFSVIIGTVMLQSLTSLPIAKWLGVVQPEPSGFLIIGANNVARRIGSVLMENGIKVLLVDTGWEKISKAKKQGLLTYHGNPISDHASRHMDLVGIGRMLALSPYESVNVAAILHYRMELGKNKVHMVSSPQNGEGDESKDKYSYSIHSTMRLFSGAVDFGTLEHLMLNGAKIRTTNITDKFGYQEFAEQQGKTGLMLFAKDPKGVVSVFHEGHRIVPKVGWSIIYLNSQGANKELF